MRHITRQAWNSAPAVRFRQGRYCQSGTGVVLGRYGRPHVGQQPIQRRGGGEQASVVLSTSVHRNINNHHHRHAYNRHGRRHRNAGINNAWHQRVADTVAAYVTRIPVGRF